MAKRTTTLSRWMLQSILVIIISLFLVILTLTIYIRNVMLTQVSNSNALTLQLYMNSLNSNLEGMEKYLSSLPSNDSNISNLNFSTDDSVRYFSINKMLDSLKMSVSIHNNFDGIFVYSKNKIREEFLYANGNYEKIANAEKLKRELIKDIDNFINQGWQIYSIEGMKYLVKVNRTGSTYCGAWISANSLLKPFANMDIGEDGIIAFVDMEGNILSSTKTMEVQRLPVSGSDNSKITINRERYILNTCTTPYTKAMIAVLMPNRSVTHDISVVQVIIIALFTVFSIGILFEIQWLNRKIAYPVRDLAKTMEMQNGLETRAKEDGRFEELNTIARKLNEMIQRIQQLNADIYERQISEQKTKLQYQQLRIRPHFLLNSLNIIYSFAQIEKYALVQQMTMCLVKYFRYILSNESELVSLLKEYEHVCNYIEIQKMRYSDNFIFEKQVAMGLEEVLIPPLTIQTFVENSIKYALGGEEKHTISVQIEKIFKNQKPYVSIGISDNGPGYPEHVLEDLKKDIDDIVQPDTIGIYNTRQRLKLIYGEDFEIQFSNKPEGGALTCLILPIALPEEDGQDKS